MIEIAIVNGAILEKIISTFQLCKITKAEMSVDKNIEEFWHFRLKFLILILDN